MGAADFLQDAWSVLGAWMAVAPDLFLGALVAIFAAATYFLLRYRPYAAIGVLEAAPGGAPDTDFSQGTPLWPQRPPASRARLVAAPVLKGIAVVAVAAGVSAALWRAIGPQAACAYTGDPFHPGLFCDPGVRLPLSFFMILVVPAAVLAAIRRFWIMGRGARLTVTEGDGAIGLHPWWIGELGVRAGERVALRHGRGFGKAATVRIETNSARTQIAVPADVRAALDLPLGDADLVLLPEHPFPVWPAVPALIGVIGLWFMAAGNWNETPVVEEEHAPLAQLQACLTAFQPQDLAVSCTPLIGTLAPADEAVVHLQIARVHQYMGNSDEAMGAYNDALARDPAMWAARQGRAELFIAQRDYNRARADLDAAIELAPSVDLYVRRGTIADWVGQSDDALRDFTAAVDLAQPANRGPIFVERALSYSMSGAQAEALADIARARLYGASDGDIAYLSGRALLLSGDGEGAQAAFEEAARLAPETAYPAIWLYIARLRAGRDDPEALRLSAAGLDPASWQAALVGVLVGDVAPDDIEPGAYVNDDMAQLEPFQAEAQSCELHFYLGEVALARADKAAARAHFEAVIKTGVGEYVEYGAARAELKLLSADGR